MQRASRKSRVRAFVLPALLVALVLALPGPAQASEYDPDETGNPVYIAGTIAYPVGYLYQNLILRPGRWLGDHTPFKQLFGQDDFEETYDW